MRGLQIIFLFIYSISMNAKIILALLLGIVVLGVGTFFLATRNSAENNLSQNTVPEKEGVYVPFFACPIENCTNAIVVFGSDKTRVIGVGFKNIPEDSPLFAIVDGTFTLDIEEGETTLVLTDKDGIEVTYRFIGEADSEGEIVKKDEIGVYGGGLVKVPESKDEFALFITVVDTRTDNVIPLGPDVISSSLKIL